MPDGQPTLDLEADLVVVGAGPAGLAAALEAAGAGLAVVLLDAAPAPGGQVWRARQGVAAPDVARAQASLARAGVRVLAGTRVVMALPDRALLVDGPEGARRVHGRRLVLATGARERLLPFPGWTLPGVFGAGGLQALVKGGWPIRGKRVLVAGTGPLLLAAAATLRREGATLVGLVEEATPLALVGFAGALVARPRKALQALDLGVALRGVPWFAGHRVVAAEGEGRVERVILADGQGVETRVDCDALAAGWGLVPQVELGHALGCVTTLSAGGRGEVGKDLEEGLERGQAPAGEGADFVRRRGAGAGPLSGPATAARIVVDAQQRTSVDGVFAAGECTGIAGVRAAQLQGRIAGQAVVADLGGAPARVGRLRAALAREQAFADRVATAFPVPPRWAERLRDDTLVCRCEDVRWAEVRAHADLRGAKLATRCGMGHCQGRLCHDALAVALHWTPLSARPPLAPAPLASLLAVPDTPLSPEEIPS